jgi:D-alanyl-D-alanine carboxypeptidase (penicillin-binding protein 5/6)
MDDARRNAFRCVRRGLIAAALLLVPTRPATLAAAPLDLSAQGAVAMDAYTGELLYSKNPDQLLYPASTTKILTALLVIEAGDLDRLVTVAPEDTRVEPSSLELRAGEQYTRRQMLYGLMLKSANDVAMALARDNAGSVAEFGKKMTARAHQLGALSSQFTNPHGLHDPAHRSTARDLAIISRAAMEQPLFRSIVSTPAYEWRNPRGTYALANKNRLLRDFPGCTGLKTGYTRAAGQVLVSAALREGREVISVVMRADRPGIWTDSRKLLELGLSAAHAPAPDPRTGTVAR